MKKSLLTFGFIFCFSILSNSSFGQLSMSYQFSSLNKIGLAYNFSKRFWTELRIYSNTFVDDFTPELVFLYNASVKERHEIYFGAGAVVNFFSGIVIPIGLEFRPFENFQRFSMQIEFEPTIDFGNENLAFQSSAGVRYTFGKNK